MSSGRRHLSAKRVKACSPLCFSRRLGLPSSVRDSNRLLGFQRTTERVQLFLEFGVDSLEGVSKLVFGHSPHYPDGVRSSQAEKSPQLQPRQQLDGMNLKPYNVELRWVREPLVSNTVRGLQHVWRLS